jgi:hypothetical protein
MSISKQSRTKGPRPFVPLCEKNFKIVQRAIATIFGHLQTGTDLKKITMDIRKGTWTATVIVTGELDNVIRGREKAEPTTSTAQKTSGRIRFVFHTE